MSKFAIPSVDEWVRSEFMEARQKQMEAQKKADIESGIFGNVIYLGEDEDIVCDDCNDEITDPTILLVEYGRRVACSTCYRKNYMHLPLRYRFLKDDGSLGDEKTPSEEP